MPDLDQLMRALVDDVVLGTRPPGAPKAIAQARRRRTTNAALIATVLVIAAGAGLAVGPLGDGGDRRSSVAASAPPSPATPVFQEDAAVEGAAFRNQLRTALSRASGWAVTERGDLTVLHPCAEDWSVEATGASGGTINLTAGDRGPKVWSDGISFPSEKQAAQAVTLLVRSLESCKATQWTVSPVGRTGAVLAATDKAVVWIRRHGHRVATLQVATRDGVPPVAVQVEVADLISSWLASLHK